MPLYRYQALDARGKKKSGLLDASSEIDAKERLRSQGLMVKQIAVRREGSRGENLKSDALIVFSIQLAQLLQAGIPLYESLMTIEEQYRGTASHRILVSLSTQIKEGTPLSRAMSAFPKSFNPLYCSMIAAGESVGALPQVLEQIVLLLSKQETLRTQIVTAMLYPGILALFCLVIIGVLLGFVIPSIEGMFEGRELNGFTAAVFATSHLVTDYGIYLLISLACFIALIFYALRQPTVRRRLQKLTLSLPLIGTLTRYTATARFSRTLTTLLDGSMPMIEALATARKTVGNAILEEDLQHVEEKILSGSTLGAELIKLNWIPPMASRMISAGETAGTTVAMLKKVAEMYEQEVEKRLTRLMTLAQPAILLIMGGIIGIVMIAILLPMSQAASFSNG